jgi:hypothetical protein
MNRTHSHALFEKANQLLFLILLLGISLRFYGLSWGLPYLFHYDEQFGVVFTSLRLEYNILKNFSFNPHFSSYGAFPLYLFLCVKNISLWISDELFHTAYSLKPLTAKSAWMYVVTLEEFYQTFSLIARYISACFGTMIIYLSYCIGKDLYTKKVGILSALFVALCVVLIQASHYGTVDNVLVFFILTTFVFSIKTFQTGRLKYYVLTGVSFGLALSTKLTSGLLFVPILTAHLLRVRRENEVSTARASSFRRLFNKEIIVTFLVALGTYSVINPYAILDYKSYFDISNQQGSALGIFFMFYADKIYEWIDYRASYHNTPMYWFHIKNLLLFGMGPLLGIVSLLGVLWACIKFTREDKLVLSWSILFFIIVGPWQFKPLRYLLPIIPFIIILGARWLIDIVFMVKNKIAANGIRGFIVIVVSFSLFYSIAFVNIFSEPDSRVQASDWIYQNVKPNATIVVEDKPHYTVPLGVKRGYVGMEKSKKPIYKVKILFDYKYFHYPQDTAELREHIVKTVSDADYIIVSEFYYHAFKWKETDDLYPIEKRFYGMLFDGSLGFSLIKKFDPKPNFLGINFDDSAAELLFKIVDHPMILIFKRTTDKKIDTIQ